MADGGEVVTGELFASLGNLLGNGTITATKGAVLDAPLRFDAITGNQVSVPFGSGGTLTVCAEGGVLGAGYKQNSGLTITGGVKIASSTGYLGYQQNSTGIAETWGEGSSWNIEGDLIVGSGGRGILLITGGGLVSVGGTLRINDHSHGSFVNMASTSILALKGDADDSLNQFLDLVQGTDDIRFWNATLGSWAPLTTATYGTDYTLEYLTTGDLAGYTLLTVGTAIPEPATWLLAAGLAICGRKVRRQRSDAGVC